MKFVVDVDAVITETDVTLTFPGDQVVKLSIEQWVRVGSPYVEAVPHVQISRPGVPAVGQAQPSVTIRKPGQ